MEDGESDGERALAPPAPPSYISSGSIEATSSPRSSPKSAKLGCRMAKSSGARDVDGRNRGVSSVSSQACPMLAKSMGRGNGICAPASSNWSCVSFRM
jgi:hypothetical protein